MSQLLALPDELVVQILCNLSFPDTLRCQSTCFKLKSIIASSPEIQYRFALELAGLQDNHACSVLSPAEKLDRLRRSQHAWRKVKAAFTRSVRVTYPPCGIYDLTAGAYLLGSLPRLDVNYLVLPVTQDDEPRWKSIAADQVILDIGLCIDEHDLVVVVTTQESREPLSTDPALYDIALHLVQISTGQRHPLAQHPKVSAYKSKYARPAVGIEIVGENVVLVLAQSLDPIQDASQPDDRVFVFEWRTGLLSMSLVAPYRSYSGLIFLDEHLLLLPNTQRGVLEIWDLPRSSSAPSPSAPLCVLELPPLAPGRSFGPLSCRAEPNPVGTRSTKPTLDPEHPLNVNRHQRPFKAKAEDAIIIFNVRIRPLQLGPHHPIPAIGFSHIYTFFVHRKSILRIVRERGSGDRALAQRIDIDFPSKAVLFPKPVAWKDWGQKTTRWLEADDVPTRWITTTAGQRAVLISSHARNTQGTGSPIVVMDFNIWNVKRMMRKRDGKEERKRERVVAREERRMRRKFRQCREWVERMDREMANHGLVDLSVPRLLHSDPLPPTLEWPRLQKSNIARVKFFLEKFGDIERRLQVGAVDGGELLDDTSDSSDSETASDTDSNVNGLNAPISMKRPEWWCLDSAQHVDRAGVCFESPVVSELPCLGYTSRGRFHYDGVLIDEERILGITTNRLDRIKNIEVQYIG